MKKLEVHSLPLKDVIKDLANKLKASYTNNCDEYTLEIPDDCGRGKIVGINFDGGIGLLIYDCEFYEDVEIRFTIDKVHPLKFLYCLEGSLRHQFEKQPEVHELEQFQNIIVASPNHDGHILFFKSNVRTEIYSLEINRKIFKTKIACDLGKASPNLQSIFKDENGENSFYYNGYYTLTLAEIFNETKLQKHKHLIGKIFSETQSYRMLTQQLIQFDDDQGEEIDTKVLGKADLSAMLEAIEIIKDELESLGSVTSIAKRVGLNSEKFQNGFKILHNKTANEYIQYLRLTLAKDLLINTDENIQEIKFKVGFKSHSYFSQLFKEVYHVTPTHFRKKFHERKNAKRNS